MVLRALSSLGLAIAVSACMSHELSFRCDVDSPECPLGQECPMVARSAQSCGDAPGLFGNDPIRVEGGKPVGCTVSLPYENPAFYGSPQRCTCSTAFDSDMARWLCPL
ncbi:MAG TPA: hypothetical protein VIX73_00565 [Kofleriaceae bacterium]|jgi:hypothetical protein